MMLCLLPTLRWFGGTSLWSTCTEVQEGLAAMCYGSWRCHGAEEALGIVRLLCSDTLCVKLCQLGPASLGGLSGVFLEVKEVSSRG
jgi:hypothetical protein